MLNYMNTTEKVKLFSFFIISFAMAIFFIKSPEFKIFMNALISLGYVGAFIVGIFFVSTFTVATATVLLIALGHTLSPIMLALIAGLGATIGNYIIFFGTKYITKKLVKKSKHKTHHPSHHHWTLPALGMLILLSPLPDELGVTLVSFFKMKTHHFILLSYLLKTVGIFLLITTSNALYS